MKTVIIDVEIEDTSATPDIVEVDENVYRIAFPFGNAELRLTGHLAALDRLVVAFDAAVHELHKARTLPLSHRT